MDKNNCLNLSQCAFEKLTFDLTHPSEREKNGRPSISLMEAKPAPMQSADQPESECGRYTFFAYGFPADTLNIDSVFKLIGCGFLHLTDVIKASGKELPKTSFCIISNEKPEALIRRLEESNVAVEEDGAGIYNVKFPFSFKIIVSEELNEDGSTHLKELMGKMEGKHP